MSNSQNQLLTVNRSSAWSRSGLFQFFALTVLLSSVAFADVRLPALFSDHMVLQRGRAVPIWGWADDGEEITVRIDRGSRGVWKTTAKDGRFMVLIQPQQINRSMEVTLTGKNTVTLHDVVMGEVWICSGQSNMQWTVEGSHEPKADIAASENSDLRLFYVPRVKADEPQSDVEAEWKLSQPDTVRGFSSVAYYFGLHLQKNLNVPVGLIHTSWGGSPAEVWVDRPTLQSNPNYKTDLLDASDKRMVDYEKRLAEWEKEKKEAEEQEKEFKKRRPGKGWVPSELYNGMIHPLIPYAIQGAIWYQGESNASRAYQYRSLFPDMIRNWRSNWGQGDFTFLEVQLAPWREAEAEPGESDWAELREAQLLATQILPNVGMAVITDLGEEKDIHPRLKKPVGDRLGLAARGIAYQEKVVHSGPLYKSCSLDGGEAVIEFDHVGKGLDIRGSKLIGFSIAGQDRKFKWADAEIISKHMIKVSSPDVKQPIAVRYGWADYPLVNLFNKEGLPASPFRTDAFPLTTGP
jgi:sialate O-acetylesterase